MAISLSGAWEEVETPLNVKRYQHLVSFDSHPIDLEWASAMERRFKLTFKQTQHLKLSHLDCRTDVCAFALDYPDDIEESSWNRDWDTVHNAIPKPTLTTSRAKVLSCTSSDLI